MLYRATLFLALYGKLRVPGQPVPATGAGQPKLATFGDNEDGR